MSEQKITLNQKSAHLAWCALVALASAKKQGKAIGNMQENIFLFEWLKQAMRQKRFHKDVAPDLRWLIAQAEHHPTNARLKEKLQYLYDSGTGKITDKNDLYRLNTILGTLKQMGWTYSLLSEMEWKKLNLTRLNPKVDLLQIRRASLEQGFDEANTQTAPVEIVLTGRVQKIEALLVSCNWKLEALDISLPHKYRLLAIS